MKQLVDFSHYEYFEHIVYSPEDKYEESHQKALTEMNICKNLDEFYDVVFDVDGALTKGNSIVLASRCEYFKTMFSRRY